MEFNTHWSVGINFRETCTSIENGDVIELELRVITAHPNSHRCEKPKAEFMALSVVTDTEWLTKCNTFLVVCTHEERWYSWNIPILRLCTYDLKQ